MPFTRERNREKERERESMEFTDDIIPPNIIPFYIFTDIKKMSLGVFCVF